MKKAASKERADLKQYEGQEIIAVYTIYGREWMDGIKRDIRHKIYGRLKCADENVVVIDEFGRETELPFSGIVSRDDTKKETVKIERIHLAPDLIAKKLIYGRNYVCEHLEARRYHACDCCGAKNNNRELPCDLEDDDKPETEYLCKLTGHLCKGHVEDTYSDNHGPDFQTGLYDHNMAMTCKDFALKDPEIDAEDESLWHLLIEKESEAMK